MLFTILAGFGIELGQFVRDIGCMLKRNLLIDDAMLFQSRGKRSYYELRPFSAEARVRQVLLSIFPNSAFKGLTGEPAAVNAAENGGFW